MSSIRDNTQYRHAVKRYILPALGSIKVVALGRDDVAALHHDLRGKPYQANRTLGVVSKMMNLAEAWGLRPDRSNPCYHIRKYKENKRERFLTPEELARLGKALDEEESFAPAAVMAFRLLLYTGARLSEIQTLKWGAYPGRPDSPAGFQDRSQDDPAERAGAGGSGRRQACGRKPLRCRRDRRGCASDGFAEALAAGAQGGRAARCAHPRLAPHVRFRGGNGGRELADGGADPGPYASADDRALRPYRRRSPAEGVGADCVIPQAGDGRIGQGLIGRNPENFHALDISVERNSSRVIAKRWSAGARGEDRYLRGVGANRTRRSRRSHGVWLRPSRERG